MVKAFDSIWIEGLLEFLSYLHSCNFMVPFQTATFSCHLMSARVAQGKVISPVLFSLYVDIPMPSRHIELAQYIDDTALIATSKQPKVLLKYLTELEKWLRNWRIAISVGKSAALLFMTRCIPTP